MNLLWIQPLCHHSPSTGAARANRVLVESMARHGHRCEVLSLDTAYGGEPELFTADPLLPSDEGAAGRAPGVATAPVVRTLPNLVDLVEAAVEAAASSAWDWVVISEDSTFALLDAVSSRTNASICYLAHGPSALPHGPYRFFPRDDAPQILSRADLVITVSRWMARYLTTWFGVEPTVIRMPYEREPLPYYDNGRSGHVTLMNASAIKGLDIALDLAAAFPQQPFAVHRGWASTAAELRRAAGADNVVVWEPTLSVESIYASTSVLLVPSLSPEGFGAVSVEAMARGIPVIASDQGGLIEAKLDVEYCLPVNGIDGYDHYRLDERRRPLARYKATDIGLWERVLAALLGDQAEYQRVRAASRRAARAFIDSVDPDGFETALLPVNATARTART